MQTALIVVCKIALLFMQFNVIIIIVICCTQLMEQIKKLRFSISLTFFWLNKTFPCTKIYDKRPLFIVEFALHRYITDFIYYANNVTNIREI